MTKWNPGFPRLHLGHHGGHNPHFAGSFPSTKAGLQPRFPRLLLGVSDGGSGKVVRSPPFSLLLVPLYHVNRRPLAQTPDAVKAEALGSFRALGSRHTLGKEDTGSPTMYQFAQDSAGFNTGSPAPWKPAIQANQAG